MSIRRLGLLVCLVNLASSAKIAFLIIDVQNCFLPGGSLQVSDGNDIIPLINDIRSKYEQHFSLVVLSQDWHCVDHISFASQHPGYNILDSILLQYDQNKRLCNSSPCDVMYNVTQTLWPDHCVINTSSAEFAQNLRRKSSDIIIKKGYNCQVDSYSAFYDNGKFDHTELQSLLTRAEIDTVFIAGLATDFCVFYTSMDAKQIGYATYMIQDASRGVSPGTVSVALNNMKSKGIHLVNSSDLSSILATLTSEASTQSSRSFIISTVVVAMVLYISTIL